MSHAESESAVKCRDRLEGRLSNYHREAARRSSRENSRQRRGAELTYRAVVSVEAADG
jgi:hypothetical protein